MAVAIKELRQIRRDRRSLLILLFIPVFFLFLYGYALNFDIRHVTLAIQDRDHSAESRALVSAFVRSAYFDRVATVENDDQIDALMNRGQARALLVIPEGFAKNVQLGQTAPGQVIKLSHGGGGPATIVMCGFLAADDTQSNPLLAALPPIFKVDMRNDPQAAWLQSSLHFAATETAHRRPGSTVVIGKLSELLFAEAVRRCIDALPPDRKARRTRHCRLL